jgi:hypothetical protein
MDEIPKDIVVDGVSIWGVDEKETRNFKSVDPFTLLEYRLKMNTTTTVIISRNSEGNT